MKGLTLKIIRPKYLVAMSFCLLTSSLLFSNITFAKGSLSKKSEVVVKYGYKQFDEISFKNKKKYWEVFFTDRGMAHEDRVLKRAFPSEIAKDRLFQLEYLLRRTQKRTKSLPSGLCASKFILVFMKEKKEVAYCLDQLNNGESRQFTHWIQKTTDLFKF